MSLVLGCLLGAGLLLARLAGALAGPNGRGTRPGPWANIRARLAQPGGRFGAIPVSAFVAVSVVVAVASAALVHGLFAVQALSCRGRDWPGSCFPSLIVVWRARARRRANRTVWPDVVDHLVSAVRSGLALPDSVSSLAQAGPVATRSAFTGFERDYRATGNFAYCIDELKVSLADPIADRILETLRMAREVGGSDLTLVLRSLAAWLRQDGAIRSEVEARQSWIVNAARLGVAAPWIVLVLLASRPEAAVAYNTSAGVAVIVGVWGSRSSPTGSWSRSGDCPRNAGGFSERRPGVGRPVRHGARRRAVVPGEPRTPRLRQPRLADRLAPYIQDLSAEARTFVGRTTVDPIPVLGTLFSPAFGWLRGVLSTVLGGADTIERRLRPSRGRIAASIRGGRSSSSGRSSASRPAPCSSCRFRPPGLPPVLAQFRAAPAHGSRRGAAARLVAAAGRDGRAWRECAASCRRCSSS